MILELNGTKVTIVDKTLGYQGDNLVDTIQVTVDKDSTWNYKLDMYKGKSKCFDSVLMTREGNICTVQLTNEILSYGGRYIFQLRGYTDTQTYHSDIFESWVNASIEYQDDCKQTDCGCDCKLPTEFYQVEDNVTEINNHPPYPGDSGKWMIWDVNKHEYVESDIDVVGGGGEEYQTKANLTTSVTAQSTDIQYPSAKAVYDAISNASIVTVEITGKGTDSDPYVSSMTFDEIYSAMQAGRTVVGIRPSSNPAFFIACVSFSSLITFTRLAVLNIMNDDVICQSFTIFKDGHITHKNSRLEETANKVTSLSADSTDRQYPSAKAVYDAIVAAQTEIVTPSAESTDTQAASAKAVWDMLGTGGSGTDISLGITSAAVGDIIKVKAVDESGKPTAWEAVSDEYELIDDVTLEETVKTFTKTFAHNYKDLVCIVNTKKYTGEALENYGAFWRLANGSGVNKTNHLIGDFISNSMDFCLYFRAICHNADLFELLYSKAGGSGVVPEQVNTANISVKANPAFAKISNFSEMSKIEIQGYQTPFQAGSRIVMWGVRA